jgi:signal transduction histidine kinase
MRNVQSRINIIVPATAICTFFIAAFFGRAVAQRYLAVQFNLRLEERVNERTRIARELHDTLLQTVQGLMLRLQAVSEILAPGKAKDELEQTLEIGDRAIIEGRRTVSDLRKLVNTKLPSALRALGDELACKGSATLRVVVEGPILDLHSILGDEIYCIAREALRNAFACAQAKHIEAEITYGKRMFRLRIRDDGKGIPAEILNEGKVGHFGLAGMRERAKQIGSQLTISSGPEVGTEIELSVKGSIAYNKTSGTPGWRLFRRKIG